MKRFIYHFLLPMCFVLAAVLWAGGGCIQPAGSGFSQPIDNRLSKVLVFSASWCGPCQRDKAMLEQMEAMGVEVQVIDIDAHPDLARKYGVTRVPTYFIYARGHQVQVTNDVSVVIDAVQQ